MNKTLLFIKKEFLELLVPTIFFLVVFFILIFNRSLLVSDHYVSITAYSAAIIGALIVGKSILIADALPLFKWFHKKRLIVNVVWRIMLYMSIVLLFQILEELIPIWSKYGDFATAVSHLPDEILWPRFLATHITLAVFLSFYSFSTALISIIGRNRFSEIFWGRKLHSSEQTKKTN